jgi:hypothetical protein
MQRKPAGTQNQHDEDDEFQSFDNYRQEIDKSVVGKCSADQVEQENQHQQAKRDVKLRPIADDFGENQANEEECDEGGGEVYDSTIPERAASKNRL